MCSLIYTYYNFFLGFELNTLIPACSCVVGTTHLIFSVIFKLIVFFHVSFCTQTVKSQYTGIMYVD